MALYFSILSLQMETTGQCDLQSLLSAATGLGSSSCLWSSHCKQWLSAFHFSSHILARLLLEASVSVTQDPNWSRV